MNVEVKPDDDLIQSAYAKWAALPKDMRGTILMDLAQTMSSHRQTVRSFAAMHDDRSDLGAQISRREQIANAYESAFYILAHAGAIPSKLVEQTDDGSEP